MRGSSWLMLTAVHGWCSIVDNLFSESWMLHPKVYLQALAQP